MVVDTRSFLKIRFEYTVEALHTLIERHSGQQVEKLETISIDIICISFYMTYLYVQV